MKNQRFLLLGSAAVILTFGGAQAAIAAMSPLQPASSYDELLEPVSNAGLALLGDDLAMAQQKPEVRIAEYGYGHHHHHHHHMRRYHHHHHHHYRNGYYECHIVRHVYIDEDGDRMVRRYRECD